MTPQRNKSRVTPRLGTCPYTGPPLQRQCRVAASAAAFWWLPSQCHHEPEHQGHCRQRYDDRHEPLDRKSTRLNSSHGYISYAVFCLKKKKNNKKNDVLN